MLFPFAPKALSRSAWLFCFAFIHFTLIANQDFDDEIVFEERIFDNEVYEWGGEWDDDDDEDENDLSGRLNGVSLLNRADIGGGNQEAQSENSQTHLDTEPTSIVNKSVNVISGLYMESERDFFIPGAEPFSLERNYVSADTDERGPFGKGWSRNYFGIARRFRQAHDKQNRHRATVLESGGSLYHYGGKERYTFRMLSDSYESAVTNCGSGVISARTNIRNNILQYREEDGTCLFKKASGEQVTYTPHKHRYTWRVTEEKKPNGNQIRYTYLDSGELGDIQTLNKNGRQLDKLSFRYGKGGNGDYIYIDHQGKTKAAYRLKSMEGRESDKAKFIMEATNEYNSKVFYEYEDKHDKAKVVKLARVIKPNGRFLETQYYHKGGNLIGSSYLKIKNEKSPVIDRVKLQRAPVGHDATAIITHRYFYDPKCYSDVYGWAEVFDAYNHKTGYRWDKYQRLEKIEKFTGTSDHQIYGTDYLYWGDVNSNDCTRLLGRCFKNKDGRCLYARIFNYDEHGNVLSDEIFGNLSGRCHSLDVCNANGRVEAHHSECYGKYHTYAWIDGLNLMTSMREGDLTYFFKYKPGTDLLELKLSTWHGRIFKREFHSYDENAMVEKTIEDDGETDDIANLSGVTQRRIRYFKNRNKYPIGLPEAIDEKYFDIATGEDILNKKYTFRYSPQGEPIAKKVYDANGKLLYTLTWEYDERGNIIKETNPLGQETTYSYDENGNKIFERASNWQYQKEYVYDFSDRLIRVDEIHDDGLKLSEHYVYNYLSQKIAFIDIYGNETRYEYDDFGRLVKTWLPPVVNENNELITPADHKEYNYYNALSVEEDFNGNACHSECNIRGKPTKKMYADGSFERMVYHLNGSLQKHVHKNGSYTTYEYDGQQRITRKATHSPDGTKLESFNYRYNTFHLLSETDPSGLRKKYKYDAAGRLIETLQGQNRKTFEYDACGRLFKTVEYDGLGEFVCSLQSFDLLDRVVSETREDSQGNCLTKITYGYDEAGNRARVTHYSDGKEFTTLTVFDSHRQPILVIDPLGNETRIDYKYDYRNAHGQNVPYSIATDHLGNTVETIKDTHGRAASIIQRNAFGAFIHGKQIFYDQNGNQCRVEETSTTRPGQEKAKHVTLWTYDGMNRVTSVTEAAGSADQHQMQIIYNAFGEKSEVIKADGVRIKYEYDLLGRVTKQTASDESVGYLYTYDQKGHLAEVQDLQGHRSAWKYDGYGRTIEETLANGLAVKFEYDGADRTKKIFFPDGSGVEMVYSAFRLAEVQRISSEGDKLYSHRYLDYDLEDKLLCAGLIGDAGKLNYQYDPTGRLVHVAHSKSTGHSLADVADSAWKESIDYDKVGNILKRELSESQAKVRYKYKYDDQYQVTAEKIHVSRGEIVRHAYKCDSLHNRQSQDGHPLVFNALNQLLDDGVYRYSYDLNGNLIRKKPKKGTQQSENKNQIQEETFFEYDALNRMIAAGSRYQRACYTYDAQNRRMSKRLEERPSIKKPWIANEETRYIYVGQNEVGSYDEKGAAIELRLLGTSRGAEIGGAVAVELHGKVYAPLHDHNGNVSALIDALTGEAVEFYRYTAFGEERILDAAGNELPESAVGNPWRFSSKRVDSETGFVYFGRRYYEPSTGRWTSADPIGRAGGSNLYAYVLNRPLTSIDLYGLYGVGAGANQFFEYASSFASTAFNCVSKCVEWVGKGIDAFGFHLVPIPGVRDALQHVGRFIAGMPMDGYHPIGKGKPIFCDLTDEGLPELGSNKIALAMGGICNSIENMKRFIRRISQELGGCNVYGCAAASDGLVVDLLKAGIRRIGIPLPGDQQITDYVTGLADKVSQVDGVLHVHAHSQGAILLDNCRSSLGELCQRVNVFTYGAGKFLDKGNFLNVVNYVSTRDIVPFVANPISYISTQFRPREDVVYLKSNYIPLADHCWDSRTYMEAITHNCNDIAFSPGSCR